ncbi:hypothetical protein [Vreelandella lionensis]|uniref:hypothetical protein n=1 Tax=Vreelandella lionensis TaxID=1144478 RepID=UPI001FB4EAA2|nr:hypothetical protein [Halomonas lionensis]
MPSPVPPPMLETSTQPVNGYQLLVAMLLMPLASSLAVASWTLYTLLAIHPVYGLLPLGSGLLLAWQTWCLARRSCTCSLMQWLLLGLALALGWFGVANQPWEFLMVGIGLGLGGAMIATGIAHAKGWMLSRWVAYLCGTLSGLSGRGRAFLADGALGRSSLWLARSAIQSADPTVHDNAVAMAFCRVTRVTPPTSLTCSFLPIDS